jgi:hypothetical protein
MAKQQRSPDQEQRARNVRLALVLLTVALVFGCGFAARMIFIGR